MHAFNIFVLLLTVLLTVTYSKLYSKKDLLRQDEEEIETEK